MGHLSPKKDMSRLGPARNGQHDTVRAGIAPRPLPTHATPDVPFDVPFEPPPDMPLAHVTRTPALSRVRGYLSPGLGGKTPLGGFIPPPRNGRGWTLSGALTLTAWRLASRLAPQLLNRRWFRALTLPGAARHANRPKP